MLLCSSILPVPAQRRSALAPVPEWDSLEPYQESITAEELNTVLRTVYLSDTEPKAWIQVSAQRALLRQDLNKTFILRLAPDSNSRREVQHAWRRAGQFLPNDEQPLSGVNIAIDPGHLGGEWAKMEERWFQIGNSTPVTEGDMTLRVAKLLAPMLQEFGARVTLVRSGTSPITAPRPEQFSVGANSQHPLTLPSKTGTLTDSSSFSDARQGSLVSTEAQLLFYRVAEIRERAKVINEQIKPDLTLCLHFNAEPWGDPEHPTLVQTNHLHLLVNGAYSDAELGYDDVRFCMVHRILDRCIEEELPLSEAIATSMAAFTRLPPYSYTTSSARSVGKTGYVWARNLLANRLYNGPVLYLEPYVMNSFEVFDRIQAGEYQGLREFNGIMRKNIYQEYAEAVALGLAQYFRENRGRLR